MHVLNYKSSKPSLFHTEIYNLGTQEYIEVNTSVKTICSHLGLSPTLTHSGGKKGWIGDNPFIFLETKKILSTGWKPKLTIEQGIIRTVEWLKANPWVYDVRDKT